MDSDEPEESLDSADRGSPTLLPLFASEIVTILNPTPVSLLAGMKRVVEPFLPLIAIRFG